MSSNRKLAANKRNGCKSSGPRTAAGKKRASRNALRHGLSAVVHRQPAPSADIERLARAICGESERPELLTQARLIAINALALRAIAAQRVALVERLQDSSAVALAKGDNSLDLARARSMQTWLARREIDELVPKVLKTYNNELKSKKQARGLGLIVPGRIFSLLEWSIRSNTNSMRSRLPKNSSNKMSGMNSRLWRRQQSISSALTATNGDAGRDKSVQSATLCI